MNILIDKLPNEKDGFQINTSFKNAILFDLLMKDNSVSDENKVKAILDLFFNNSSINYQKALNEPLNALQVAIWFYKGGDKEIEEKKEEKMEGNTNKKLIYSFEYDDKYIFSAFMEQYGIDLTETDLHWWKFKAMLECLNENVLFSKIMSYRAIDLGKIKDKEERKRYKKLQDIYKLPDMRTAEEKQADFNSLFW